VLLNHLVGRGADQRRHRQPKRLGRPEIDNQLDSDRLLDRQIGWLRAPEDLSGVNAELPVRLVA
jgi:hypothetical protein